MKMVCLGNYILLK